jgi:hypothetical protein
MLAPLSGGPLIAKQNQSCLLSPLSSSAQLGPAASIGVMQLGGSSGSLPVMPPVGRPQLLQLGTERSNGLDSISAAGPRKSKPLCAAGGKGKQNARLEAALPEGVDLLESDLRGYTIKCDAAGSMHLISVLNAKFLRINVIAGMVM